MYVLKVVNKDMLPTHANRIFKPWEIGKKRVFRGRELIVCRSGYHFTNAKSLHAWFTPNARVFIAKVGEDRIDMDSRRFLLEDKGVAREMTLVREITDKLPKNPDWYTSRAYKSLLEQVSQLYLDAERDGVNYL